MVGQCGGWEHNVIRGHQVADADRNNTILGHNGLAEIRGKLRM